MHVLQICISIPGMCTLPCPSRAEISYKEIVNAKFPGCFQTQFSCSFQWCTFCWCKSNSMYRNMNISIHGNGACVQPEFSAYRSQLTGKLSGPFERTYNTGLEGTYIDFTFTLFVHPFVFLPLNQSMARHRPRNLRLRARPEVSGTGFPVSRHGLSNANSVWHGTRPWLRLRHQI